MEKFSIHDELSIFYKENGFLVLKDLFSQDELTETLNDIYKLFETRFKDLDNKTLNRIELINNYYNAEKEIWSQCEKHMWDLLSILRLASKIEVTNALKKIGLKSPMILTRPEVRTDMPDDRQYMQPWHQDWRYSKTSLNAITIWIPLHDVRKENGTIDVIPKSHLFGLLKEKEIPNPRRFVISDERISGLPFETMELNHGDCVIFSQFIVHRSGNNTSGKPRITTQQRVTDYSESTYIERGMPIADSPEELINGFPTAEDVERVFKY
ncbi:phytanoyl-CoA dioxygenase family protein [Bacteroidales bacterium AH-315-N07]|nr:phytanoyl-CoA dioxygenase family protein [Bacteroidales bacterium AH-315-N07]